LPQLVLNAYDVQKYLREALPALRAAIYRGDLSQAKDVLALYDDTVYDEYELSQVLIENDYSWVFSEDAGDPDAADPEGTLVGLAYPLILAYHHPELFHADLRGTGLEKLFQPNGHITNGGNGSIGSPGSKGTFHVEPGFREGLRAMWEITGFITPDTTIELRDYCRKLLSERVVPDGVSRRLHDMISDLDQVIALGYGLVIERE
jgi:hypothetical protein